MFILKGISARAKSAERAHPSFIHRYEDSASKILPGNVQQRFLGKHASQSIAKSDQQSQNSQSHTRFAHQAIHPSKKNVSVAQCDRRIFTLQYIQPQPYDLFFIAAIW